MSILQSIKRVFAKPILQPRPEDYATVRLFERALRAAGYSKQEAVTVASIQWRHREQ